MALSTNSVIHYTERFEYLCGIIYCSGFRYKYCHEQISIEAPGLVDVAIPMVSFCDIPLSEVKNHIDTYGSYGIGLTKSWAKNVGMNPVLYVERKSNYAALLRDQATGLGKLPENNERDKMIEHYLSLFAYCKNYEGRLVRGKINTDSYRFYDEREWRYIPKEEELKGAFVRLLGTQYAEDKEAYNEKLKDCYLKFTPGDISYIIVDSDEEIPEVLEILTKAYDPIATGRELKVLSTRILTKNQIWNDF